MLSFFPLSLPETRAKQSAEKVRRANREKLPAHPCHHLIHVWFNVLWETSAQDVTMAVPCSHPPWESGGPWIINDTRPHQEQYESRSPHRRNKMFPLSIHSPQRRCMHSRLLTIASNYPHFFPPADEILAESPSRLRFCASVLAKQGGGGEGRQAAGKRDSMCLSEWRWRVSVWLVNPV